MINNNRTIENAWSMLQYLYFELRSKKFKNIDITMCKTLDDLYALVIATWSLALAKEGLYKEYVEHENEELTSPRGQINIIESVMQQTMCRGSLICSYDELSEDVYLNHILKGTLQYLLFDNNIDKLVKNEVKKSIQSFSSIGFIDMNLIHWKDIKYNNSNIRYKHIISLCKTLYFEHKLEKQLGLDDSRRIYLLFKKQIIKWYKLKYGDVDDVDTVEMPYTLDSESPFETYINKMQKIVAINTDEHALLIMVRLQDEQMIKDPRLPRQRLDEFVRYLREYKMQHKVVVSGAMVYININPKKLNLQPITVNNVDDFMIGETVIDLHDQWKFIANKLEDTYKYFIGKAKNSKLHK